MESGLRERDREDAPPPRPPPTSPEGAVPERTLHGGAPGKRGGAGPVIRLSMEPATLRETAPQLLTAGAL